MVFAGCFRACDWRGAGLDLAGGWRSTAWSWLVMFGLLFLLFISSFLQIFGGKFAILRKKKFGRYCSWILRGLLDKRLLGVPCLLNTE